jgi:hypothetical protein
MTPMGIKPATFRLLAQCLSQLHYHKDYILYIHIYCSDQDSGILGSVLEYSDCSRREGFVVEE